MSGIRRLRCAGLGRIAVRCLVVFVLGLTSGGGADSAAAVDDRQVDVPASLEPEEPPKVSDDAAKQGAFDVEWWSVQVDYYDGRIRRSIDASTYHVGMIFSMGRHNPGVAALARGLQLSNADVLMPRIKDACEGRADRESRLLLDVASQYIAEQERLSETLVQRADAGHALARALAAAQAAK